MKKIETLTEKAQLNEVFDRLFPLLPITFKKPPPTTHINKTPPPRTS